jgi:SAM-dependent methyltransferase
MSQRANVPRGGSSGSLDDLTPVVVQHPRFGPAMPGLNWVPAPRYILRRDRILRHLRGMAPCKVLDIGCGPGALISELSRRGFDAYGVDGSSKARALAQHLQSQCKRMQIHSDFRADWKGTFDLVLSFEVIEHLHDDVGALRDWRRYLKTGGKLILSTPAHPNRWNAADEWAGHVRRYEGPQLVRAIESAGFKIESVECYGFPLANVMEVFRARTYKSQLRRKRQVLKDAHALTEDSGSDRAIEARLWPVFSSGAASMAMWLFCQIQRPFLKTELGNGFIVVAKAL